MLVNGHSESRSSIQKMRVCYIDKEESNAPFTPPPSVTTRLPQLPKLPVYATPSDQGTSRTHADAEDSTSASKVQHPRHWQQGTP
jgi:hypothetical protein